MPAFTLAQLRIQIDECVADLSKAQEAQEFTSGGPGAGMHTARGAVMSLQKRLEWLCREYDRLEAIENGGTIAKAQFQRPQ